jgi:hypothetical protein
VAALLALTLLLLKYPDALNLLWMLDAIGIDVIVILLGLQLRTGIELLRPVFRPVLRHLHAIDPRLHSPWLQGVRVSLDWARSPLVALALIALGTLAQFPPLLLAVAALTARGQMLLDWARSFVHLVDEAFRRPLPA